MKDILNILCKRKTKKNKKLISYFFYVYKKALIYEFDMNVKINLTRKVETYIENEIYKIVLSFDKYGIEININIINKKSNDHLSKIIYYLSNQFDYTNGSTYKLLNNFNIKEI